MGGGQRGRHNAAGTCSQYTGYLSQYIPWRKRVAGAFVQTGNKEDVELRESITMRTKTTAKTNQPHIHLKPKEKGQEDKERVKTMNNKHQYYNF